MSAPEQNLFDAARAWCALVYGVQVREIRLRLDTGEEVRLPVPCRVVSPTIAQEAFIPNDLQAAVLVALEGKALTTDALASKVQCDRRNLFRKPGGLDELKAQGLLRNHSRLGYYRPDAPPPELEGE